MWSKTWEHTIGLGYILEFREAPSFVDKPMRRKRERERERGVGMEGGMGRERDLILVEFFLIIYFELPKIYFEQS